MESITRITIGKASTGGSDAHHARIDRIKKRNKILGLVTSAIFLMQPIPLIFGEIGVSGKRE